MSNIDTHCDRGDLGVEDGSDADDNVSKNGDDGRSLLSPWYSARIRAESADPRTPIFWCIVASPFCADPCRSAWNDVESGSFSHGSMEFTRTVPC